MGAKRGKFRRAKGFSYVLDDFCVICLRSIYAVFGTRFKGYLRRIPNRFWTQWSLAGTAWFLDREALSASGWRAHWARIARCGSGGKGICSEERVLLNSGKSIHIIWYPCQRTKVARPRQGRQLSAIASSSLRDGRSARPFTFWAPTMMPRSLAGQASVRRRANRR